MTAQPAKTDAQRQADRKARELAAGRVQWKRWVHPDDVQALADYAAKLQRKREREGKRISDKLASLASRELAAPQ
jgi:hypothetical protein